MKSPTFLDSTLDTLRNSSKLDCFNRSNIEEQMAKMKKMIKSPTNKRKEQGRTNTGTFGVSLEELLNRNSEERDIPAVVVRIADFIKLHGIKQEGIFRVNGNVRVVEALKAEFNRFGNADLEESGDIMSVAGLMKMFLRELPEPLIPNHFKTSFIQVHKDYHADNAECCSRMRKLAADLPKPNGRLLKFLCSFLVEISLHKDSNKMGSKALAIVFAPNIFRSPEGIEGFKEQSMTNNVVAMFINEYDAIFKGENEESPYLLKCIHVKEAGPNVRDRPAIPVPYHEHKKIKHQKQPALPTDDPELITPYAEYRIGDDNELVIVDDSKTVPPVPQENHIYATVDKSQRDALLRARVHHLPDEAEPYIRSNSPSWHKPNEEHSSDHSPKLGSSSRTRKRIVEKTIKESINEHLFGQNLTSTSEESDKLDSPGEEAPPVPPKICVLLLDEATVKPQKRRKRRGSKTSQDCPKNSPSEDTALGDVVDGLVSTGSEDNKTDPRQKADQDVNASPSKATKRSHKSKFAAMENNQQLTIRVEDYDAVVDTPSCECVVNQYSEISGEGNVDLSNVAKPCGVLLCLTRHRAPPPRKRRPPSLHKSLPAKMDFRISDMPDAAKGDAKSLLPRKPPSPPPRPNLSPNNSISPAVVPKSERRRRSISELAKVASDGEVDSELSSGCSEDSPDSSAKSGKSEGVPVIPPLELYKLGEMHDDDNTCTLISPRERYDGSGFDDTMVSPRSRRSTLDIRGFSTECPPSPPAMQENHFWLDKKQSTSPKGETTVKELTRRSQSLKKKIKEFEEKFEEDNGHKPTQSQDRQPIKKYVSELGRTRKMIQELKEKRSISEKTLSEISPAASGSRKELLLTMVPGTVEQSLEMSLNKLKEKREAGGRPDDVEAMSRDQVQDEKLAIQKALLQHENTFGRPITKREKDVMKPLYDRYRTVKRKISSFPLKGTAQPTQPIKIPTDKKHEVFQPDRPSDLELTASLGQDSPFGSPSELNTRLTQSLPLRTAKDKARKLFENDSSPVSPLTICVDDTDNDSTILLEGEDASFTGDEKTDRLSVKDTDAILHQASTQELLEQQATAVKRKKKLRKKLKVFEDNFVKTNGRKVQKEDRGPRESDYEEYKKLKARLRLLDALITKNQGNSTI